MPDNRELAGLVERGISQLREEGVDVSLPSQGAVAITNLPDASQAQAWQDLLEDLDSLAVFSTDQEPFSLSEILRLRPVSAPTLPGVGGGARLRDQILGGWLGRCAGCLLGKPLEGTIHDAPGIERYLREADAYPLRDYVPLRPELPERFPRRGFSATTRGTIHGMPIDDDIDYAVLNLLILEKLGRDFASAAAADEWLLLLSYHHIYAAGRAAYRNMVNGLTPPQTATFRNPFRQSLGGQIRADIWGWVCPGDPAAAAAMAYRDSTISQTRNGVYSGMFFAAVIAASFVAPDVPTAVQAGLAQVPAQCTLAQSVRTLMQWIDDDRDWRRTVGRIEERYGHQAVNYSTVNALISLLGPLSSPADFTDAIGIAVMGGFDTDCTGATAGSIMGVRLGAAALPRAWTDPLEDDYHSSVTGVGHVAISELAERTFRQAFP